jgi:hypothetical protein
MGGSACGRTPRGSMALAAKRRLRFAAKAMGIRPSATDLRPHADTPKRLYAATPPSTSQQSRQFDHIMRNKVPSVLRAEVF